MTAENLRYFIGKIRGSDDPKYTILDTVSGGSIAFSKLNELAEHVARHYNNYKSVAYVVPDNEIGYERFSDLELKIFGEILNTKGIK